MAGDRLTIRLHPGSAAEAVANGKVSALLGATQRINDVCLRYAIIMGMTDHGVDAEEVRILAKHLLDYRRPWPVYSLEMMRAMLWEASRHNPAQALHLKSLTHAQLIRLVEDVEEIYAAEVKA